MIALDPPVGASPYSAAEGEERAVAQQVCGHGRAECHVSYRAPECIVPGRSFSVFPASHSAKRQGTDAATAMTGATTSASSIISSS